MLTLLCSRAPALLRSEEIIEALWPRDAAAGNGLHKSITELRRAFEDDPARPVYIETVRKRGYRLVAPISGTEMVVLAVLAGSGAAP